ncbi:MAG: UDP-N-acetylmuramoyl-L-alanyl-D-glutamate--2,6-diaminopimelate ligase [Clostridia bacterium]|nr:UDP-N-acetylmuramoyl-L-alanyl-D-glutamate--2,6-diaminopimelate ligase [Clostridia bacterium]
MLIAELLSGLKYNTYGVNLRGYVSGAASDSRRITFGSVFICLRGTRRDGHDYACDAMRRGAVAVVCDHYLPRIPCIVVKDTRLADAVIWNNLSLRPANGLRLIGVTGTNGKTSTAMFIASVMNEMGIPTALLGTLGCSFGGETLSTDGAEVDDVPAAMTTPDPEILYKTLASLRKKGAEAVVMEVSSHAIAQRKIAPLIFEVGVFTNLTPDHLDYHGSMEEYYRVKASMFSRCKMSVICCDSPYGVRLAEETRKTVRVCSSDAEGVVLTDGGVSYEYEGLHIHSNVPGAFTVQNTMLAAKVGRLLGGKADALQRGIACVKSIPGRMEKIGTDSKKNLDVFIDYAHTPDALEKAVSTVKQFAPYRRLTVVFGCGGDRDASKRPRMGQIASEKADRAIVTSDNPRSEEKEKIIRDILSGVRRFEKVRVITDRAEAIRYSLLTAVHDEIILLCGKGHEDYETDASGKHHFSEKEIVSDILQG